MKVRLHVCPRAPVVGRHPHLETAFALEPRPAGEVITDLLNAWKRLKHAMEAVGPEMCLRRTAKQTLTSSKLSSTRIPRCITSRSSHQTTRRASWSGCRRQQKLLQGRLGRNGTTSTLSDCLAHVWPRAAYILWVRPAKRHGTHTRLHGFVTRVGAGRQTRCTCVGLLIQPRRRASRKSRRSFFCFRVTTKRGN